MKNVKALILGGGQGKRLFPLTKYRSKAAVPIGGKYRLVDIPISNCLHSGIKDIYVVTQFNSESLNNHINNTYRFDYFSRAFVRILAAEQTLDNLNWLQGTADAVRKNIAHLGIKDDDEILVLSGDHLYKMDYHKLLEFHRQNNADITVSVIPIKEDETKEFGILKLKDNGHILHFREKPKTHAELKGYKFSGKNTGAGKSVYLASMGVYVFKAKVLLEALDGADVDFGKEVIPHSIERFNVFGYVFNDYWKDVGTIKAFYEANLDLALHKPHFSFLQSPVVFTRPRFLPPAKMSHCIISDSLLAEGCIVNDAYIERSVIGLRTVVGKGCKITDTIIMGADYYEEQHGQGQVKIGIGDGSAIDKAIIDKNARIGRNVMIKNTKNVKEYDGDDYCIRGGIVIVTKNSIIKDGTKI